MGFSPNPAGHRSASVYIDCMATMQIQLFHTLFIVPKRATDVRLNGICVSV